MRNFRELKVWEKSHQITLAVYRATAHYPKDELYGLTSQTRRASASIPANIAEGCARATDLDFARFMQTQSAPPVSLSTICFLYPKAES